MVSSVVTSLPLLAQMDTLGDFLNQVRGLIAFICVLGVLWIVTLVITLQRNAERRRREKLGLEPLPGIWVSAQQWLKGEGEKKKHDVPSFRTDPAPDALDPGLAPDLDLLTGNLDDEPAPRVPASPPPAAPPPPKTPVTPVPSPSTNLLEDAFTFDDDPPKVAAAPVAVAPVPGTPPPPDSAELLRVFRDLAEGSLVLQIDGHRYDSVNDLVAAGLSRRFTKVVRDLALLVRAVKESSADTAAALSPARADDLPPDLVELLRVFRDLSEGSLIIEIDGQRFGEVDDLVAAGLSRRFTKVVRDLALLVREAQKIEVKSPPPAQPPAQPASPPPVAPRAPTQPPSRPISRPLIPLPDNELPSMDPGTMLRQMTRAAMGRKPETPAEEPAPPPLSIAEQIDELLQARLQQMPEYRGRKITVQPSLSGGVQIRVDDTYYEGVGDVAEDDVRELLQDVVREWEERYS